MISSVVTGAANGIGRAIAARLVADGAVVVGLDLDSTGLEAAATEFGDAFRPVVGDIADWGAHDHAATVAADVGELRWWVNNAGVDWIGAAHVVDAVHIDQGLRTLLNGPMYGAAVAVRRMLLRRAGSIVNIASIQGLAAFPQHFVYDAAKAGLLMATKSIAVDYGPFGIRCNVVLPGVIESPMTIASLPHGLDRDAGLRREGDLAPLQRVGQPEEIASVVAFLLSDHASYLNGAEVVADGGAMARCYAYPPLELESDV